MTCQPTISLDYAPVPGVRNYLRRVRIFRRVALGCAVAPMAIGVGIVLLYWLIDWVLLPPAGLLMLPVGGLAVLVGLIFAMLAHGYQAAWARQNQTRVRVWPLVGAILLLLANLPVALGCMWFGIGLFSQPIVGVTVVNDTGAPLDHCVVRSVWSPRFHGSLEAGQSMFEGFKLNRTRGLYVRLEQGGMKKDVALSVPPSFDPPGGTLTIHVKARLDLDISENIDPGC